MVTTWRHAIDTTETPWQSADFERYCLGPVFRYFSCQLASRDDAEDLTMDVYGACLQSLRRAQATRNPKAWVMTIAQRKLADYLRRRRTHDSQQPDEIWFADPHFSLAVRGVLSQLPERERRALVLKYIAELSQSEIAELENVSVEAVNSLLQRSRAAFRALGSHLVDPEESL